MISWKAILFQPDAVRYASAEFIGTYKVHVEFKNGFMIFGGVIGLQ